LGDPVKWRTPSDAAAGDELGRDDVALDFVGAFADAQQRAGVIAADLDIESVTPWLAWMIERGMYQLTSESDDPAADRLDGMTTIVWQTLYERASRDAAAL
jgi:hypothetical protein